MSTRPIHSTQGVLTYAQVDCPDDVWRFAIVTRYEDAQTYGEIIMAFAPEFEPDHQSVRKMLEALQ